MQTNRFQRGQRPVFICATCGRSTRLAGQGNNQLCAECWELSGLENSVLDGASIDQIAGERDYWANKAIKLGSDPAKIRASFSDLYTH